MTWAHARQVPGTAASKGVRIRGYRFRRGCVEGFPGTDPTPALRADIFRPQGRMGPNELCHQLVAPRVLKHFHRHPTALSSAPASVAMIAPLASSGCPVASRCQNGVKGGASSRLGAHDITITGAILRRRW